MTRDRQPVSGDSPTDLFHVTETAKIDFTVSVGYDAAQKGFTGTWGLADLDGDGVADLRCGAQSHFNDGEGKFPRSLGDETVPRGRLVGMAALGVYEREKLPSRVDEILLGTGMLVNWKKSFTTAGDATPTVPGLFRQGSPSVLCVPVAYGDLNRDGYTDILGCRYKIAPREVMMDRRV